MLAKAKREIEAQRELLMTKSLPGLVDDQSSSSVNDNNESDSESDTESDDKSKTWIIEANLEPFHFHLVFSLFINSSGRDAGRVERH